MMRPQCRDHGAPKEAVSKNSRLVPGEKTYSEAIQTAARPPVKEVSKKTTHQKVANKKVVRNQRRKKTQKENATKTVDKDEELVLLPTIYGPKKGIAKYTPTNNLSESRKKTIQQISPNDIEVVSSQSVPSAQRDEKGASSADDFEDDAIYGHDDGPARPHRTLTVSGQQGNGAIQADIVVHAVEVRGSQCLGSGVETVRSMTRVGDVNDRNNTRESEEQKDSSRRYMEVRVMNVEERDSISGDKEKDSRSGDVEVRDSRSEDVEKDSRSGDVEERDSRGGDMEERDSRSGDEEEDSIGSGREVERDSASGGDEDDDDVDDQGDGDDDADDQDDFDVEDDRDDDDDKDSNGWESASESAGGDVERDNNAHGVEENQLSSQETGRSAAVNETSGVRQLSIPESLQRVAVGSGRARAAKQMLEPEEAEPRQTRAMAARSRRSGGSRSLDRPAVKGRPWR
jgi:hypothetical protein